MRLEDVIWVKLDQRETTQAVFVACCYFPPAGSRWDIDTKECLATWFEGAG